MNKHWIVDTNILISALFNSQGNERKALEFVKRNGIILVSPDLRQEYLEVLSRSKFDKYISLETRMGLFVNIVEDALEIVPSNNVKICRDPKDDFILSLALESKPDCIISGDKDLLVLNPFEEIPIVNATEFLRINS